MVKYSEALYLPVLGFITTGQTFNGNTSQGEIQAVYDLFGNNAPDIVPIELADIHATTGYILYLGENQWWYRSVFGAWTALIPSMSGFTPIITEIYTYYN